MEIGFTAIDQYFLKKRYRSYRWFPRHYDPVYRIKNLPEHIRHCYLKNIPGPEFLE